MTQADEEQQLYIIEKRYRSSPGETQTISAYYIVRNKIMQAPTLKRVIDAKS